MLLLQNKDNQSPSFSASYTNHEKNTAQRYYLISCKEVRLSCCISLFFSSEHFGASSGKSFCDKRNEKMVCRKVRDCIVCIDFHLPQGCMFIYLIFIFFGGSIGASRQKKSQIKINYHTEEYGWNCYIHSKILIVKLTLLGSYMVPL